jgi:hypothetical protein
MLIPRRLVARIAGLGSLPEERRSGRSTQWVYLPNSTPVLGKEQSYLRSSPEAYLRASVPQTSSRPHLKVRGSTLQEGNTDERRASTARDGVQSAVAAGTHEQAGLGFPSFFGFVGGAGLAGKGIVWYFCQLGWVGVVVGLGGAGGCAGLFYR